MDDLGIIDLGYQFMTRGVGGSASSTTSNAPVSAALGDLMEDLHAAVACELDIAQNDLQQIHALLADAADKLNESFMAFNTQIRLQQDLLLAITNNIEKEQVAGSADMKKNLGEVSGITDTIHASVGLAIQALQFEDISGQVVTHSQMQLQQLSGLFSDLQQVFNTPEAKAADVSLAHIEQQLVKSREMVAECRQQWATTRHKAVSQETMQVGDIELF